MTREEAIDFLECRRAYYTSLSTDPNLYTKATKVCGYTLAESANACLIAIEALKQESVLDKIRAEMDKRKSTIDKAISEDELKIEGMKEAYTDCLEIIDKYRAESEV